MSIRELVEWFRDRRLLRAYDRGAFDGALYLPWVVCCAVRRRDIRRGTWKGDT